MGEQSYMEPGRRGFNNEELTRWEIMTLYHCKEIIVGKDRNSINMPLEHERGIECEIEAELWHRCL